MTNHELAVFNMIKEDQRQNFLCAQAGHIELAQFWCNQALADLDHLCACLMAKGKGAMISGLIATLNAELKKMK